MSSKESFQNKSVHFLEPEVLGRVSVVIPCRNENGAIQKCIESIMASQIADLEILVVDGMSTDGTRESLQVLITRFSRPGRILKCIDNPNLTTPFAFNAGILNSTGEFVQIVGSRNLLDPHYIPSLISALQSDDKIGCVGGDYQHSFQNQSSQALALAMESKFGVGGSNYRTMSKSGYVDTVGVPMYRRSIFCELGLFDEMLTRNQDDDFNFRLTQAGFKVYYVHEAKNIYFVRGSLQKAFKQYSQYGYFKVFVNQKHQTVTTFRQLVPPLFVAFLASGVPLALASLFMDQTTALSKFPAAFVGLVLAFYLVLGFTFGWQATKSSTLSVPYRLPLAIQVQLAIFVLHFGYGFGYLKGIWDFLLLRRTPALQMQKMTT